MAEGTGLGGSVQAPCEDVGSESTKISWREWMNRKSLILVAMLTSAPALSARRRRLSRSKLGGGVA